MCYLIVSKLHAVSDLVLIANRSTEALTVRLMLPLKFEVLHVSYLDSLLRIAPPGVATPENTSALQ